MSPDQCHVSSLVLLCQLDKARRRSIIKHKWCCVMQGDPKRRPRLTRRVQSAHGYEVSAVSTDGDSEAAKEIGILRSLCHPNIVRLIEVIGEKRCHLHFCRLSILPMVSACMEVV